LAFRLVITPLEVEIIAIPKSSKTLGNSFEFEYTRNPGLLIRLILQITGFRVFLYISMTLMYIFLILHNFQSLHKSSFKIDAIAKDILVGNLNNLVLYHIGISILVNISEIVSLTQLSPYMI
jgi:hypothetical protein